MAVDLKDPTTLGFGLGLTALGAIVGMAVSMSGKQKGSMHNALTACSSLPPSERLYKAAKEELLWRYDRGGKTAQGLSSILNVNERTAQRLLLSYNVRPLNESRINARFR